MSEEITISKEEYDKFLEYQQVAAILAMRIDVAWLVAERREEDAEMLYGQLRLLKENRDKIIEDPEARERQYSSASLVFALGNKE